MPLRQLIIMRHGETDWNAERRMQGHQDVPLNDVGRAQASAASASVAAMHPEAIVSSDLRRAVDTAAPIAHLTQVAMRTDARLRETSMGRWTGLTRDQVIAQWPEHWQRWRTTGARIAPPDGESRVQVAQRAASVVEELDGSELERVLLVAHGGLIVGLTGHLLQWPQPEWNRAEGIGNCHWVILHRLAGRWRLHTYNGGLGDIVLPTTVDDVVDD